MRLARPNRSLTAFLSDLLFKPVCVLFFAVYVLLWSAKTAPKNAAGGAAAVILCSEPADLRTTAAVDPTQQASVASTAGKSRPLKQRDSRTPGKIERALRASVAPSAICAVMHCRNGRSPMPPGR